MTAFREAIEVLQPGATGTDMVALLDGRAKRTTTLEWKAGRKHAPQWVLRLLAAKIRQRVAKPLELADKLERAPERIGKRAGAINLARWKQAQSTKAIDPP